MKKGFTLVELMVSIVITAILAAVAISKFFDKMCKNDLEKCKVEYPENYKDVCLSKPAICPEKDVYTYCAANMAQCIRNQVSFIMYLQHEKKLREEKAAQNTECNTEVKHDTVYVFVKNAVVHVTDEPAPANAINLTTVTTTTCVENCKKNYVSESLVKFCIKNYCK